MKVNFTGKVKNLINIHPNHWTSWNSLHVHVQYNFIIKYCKLGLIIFIGIAWYSNCNHAYKTPILFEVLFLQLWVQLFWGLESWNVSTSEPWISRERDHQGRQSYMRSISYFSNVAKGFVILYLTLLMQV